MWLNVSVSWSVSLDRPMYNRIYYTLVFTVVRLMRSIRIPKRSMLLLTAFHTCRTNHVADRSNRGYATTKSYCTDGSRDGRVTVVLADAGFWWWCCCCSISTNQKLWCIHASLVLRRCEQAKKLLCSITECNIYVPWSGMANFVARKHYLSAQM